MRTTLFLGAAFVMSAATSIYDFNSKTIDGTDASLTDYKGKVALIVNTASA